MKTYKIHGVDFPVWSDDGYPDLHSVASLKHTLKHAAEANHGFANDECTVFTFDGGYSAGYGAACFVDKAKLLAPFVSDVEGRDDGRLAWGGARYVVTLKLHTEFCYENVWTEKELAKNKKTKSL